MLSCCVIRDDGRCQCGRSESDETHVNPTEDTEWTSERHSSELNTDANGWVKFEEERGSRDVSV